jgi:hypothetical protein
MLGASSVSRVRNLTEIADAFVGFAKEHEFSFWPED